MRGGIGAWESEISNDNPSTYNNDSNNSATATTAIDRTLTLSQLPVPLAPAASKWLYRRSHLVLQLPAAVAQKLPDQSYPNLLEDKLIHFTLGIVNLVHSRKFVMILCYSRVGLLLDIPSRRSAPLVVCYAVADRRLQL